MWRHGGLINGHDSSATAEECHQNELDFWIWFLYNFYFYLQFFFKFWSLWSLFYYSCVLYIFDNNNSNKNIVIDFIMQCFDWLLQI